jgi:hypothetical protein
MNYIEKIDMELTGSIKLSKRLGDWGLSRRTFEAGESYMQPIAWTSADNDGVISICRIGGNSRDPFALADVICTVASEEHAVNELKRIAAEGC